MCAAGASCSYPFLQCIKGQWVAIPAGAADSGALSACYLNGQGHAAEDVPLGCGFESAEKVLTRDAVSLNPQCKIYNSGNPLCTATGWIGGSWGGGYINPQNVTVACTSSNGLLVPGNMQVLGNPCADGSQTTSCGAYYICKRDGWWILDGVGFEIRKVSSPWILPENFYPQF
jgi:hypothetical protein